MQVDSKAIWGLPFWWQERIATNYPVSPDHHHDWFWFNTTSRGLLGGTARYCRIGIYADKSVAPDGRQ
jgi:hypothetical protein